MIYLQKVLYDGDERKAPKYTKKNENKEKNLPFSYPPFPPSTKWRPTVFRCPKTAKDKPELP